MRFLSIDDPIPVPVAGALRGWSSDEKMEPDMFTTDMALDLAMDLANYPENPVCPAFAVSTAIRHPCFSITHTDQVELTTNNRLDKFPPNFKKSNLSPVLQESRDKKCNFYDAYLKTLDMAVREVDEITAAHYDNEEVARGALESFEPHEDIREAEIEIDNNASKIFPAKQYA